MKETSLMNLTQKFYNVNKIFYKVEKTVQEKDLIWSDKLKFRSFNKNIFFK